MAKFDTSEISAKDIANIAKDAEHSLWWMFVESWLKNSKEEAQYQKDMADNHTDFIKWKAIESTVSELLAMRMTVIEMAKQNSAIPKEVEDRRFPAAQNKGE